MVQLMEALSIQSNQKNLELNTLKMKNISKLNSLHKKLYKKK